MDHSIYGAANGLIERFPFPSEVPVAMKHLARHGGKPSSPESLEYIAKLLERQKP